MTRGNSSAMRSHGLRHHRTMMCCFMDKLDILGIHSSMLIKIQTSTRSPGEQINSNNYFHLLSPFLQHLWNYESSEHNNYQRKYHFKCCHPSYYLQDHKLSNNWKCLYVYQKQENANTLFLSCYQILQQFLDIVSLEIYLPCQQQQRPQMFSNRLIGMQIQIKPRFCSVYCSLFQFKLRLQNPMYLKASAPIGVSVYIPNNRI